MKNSKVIDFLSYAVVLVAVILFVVFKNNIKISLIIIGIGGSLFGIFSLIKNETYGSYITSVSVILVITMILYLTSVLNRDNAVTFMIVGSFGFLMLLSGFMTIISRKICKKVYSNVVIGSVIDLKKNPNTKKEFYNVIYGYKVGNNEYSVINPYVVSKKIPSLGDQINIYVNPLDPTDVWFDIDKMVLIKELCMEVIAVILSIIIIITLFI